MLVFVKKSHYVVVLHSKEKKIQILLEGLS